MEGTLRGVHEGYEGYTLSYQIRSCRGRLLTNRGAECNRHNHPYILTSSRLRTIARGAAHRRKHRPRTWAEVRRPSPAPPRPASAKEADGGSSWVQRERRRAKGRTVVASATSRAWRPIGHRGRSRASLVWSEPAAADDQPSWIRRASPRPWPRPGLQGQTKRLSDHAEAADCGQLAAERRREVVSRGSRHAGRGAAGEGEGRRLTRACRALPPSCRGRRRLTSDGRCSGHSVRAQRPRPTDLASHATVLPSRHLGSLLGGHTARPFADAGPRRVQEGRCADRRSRMEAATRAAAVLPPTI